MREAVVPRLTNCVENLGRVIEDFVPCKDLLLVREAKAYCEVLYKCDVTLQIHCLSVPLSGGVISCANSKTSRFST